MTTLTHYFTREQNKSIQSKLGVKVGDIFALVCKRHEEKYERISKYRFMVTRLYNTVIVVDIVITN
jgi:hypothetical protein